MGMYDDMISLALDKLTPRARQGYTGDVLRGIRNWSGSDLEGKAKRFGSSYRVQRQIAEKCLTSVGGVLIYTAPHNKKVAGKIMPNGDVLGKAGYYHRGPGGPQWALWLPNPKGE